MAKARLSGVVLALDLFSLGSAQNTFVGAGVSLHSNFQSVWPMLSLHAGTEVAPGLRLRGSLETVFVITLISADLLATILTGSPDLRVYAGGGLDVGLFTLISEYGSFSGLHGTTGFEWHSGQLGFFGEAQPLLILGSGLGVRLKGGVNVYL